MNSFRYVKFWIYVYKWYELLYRFKVQDHISYLLINCSVTHISPWLKFHYHPLKVPSPPE